MGTGRLVNVLALRLDLFSSSHKSPLGSDGLVQISVIASSRFGKPQNFELIDFRLFLFLVLRQTDPEWVF